MLTLRTTKGVRFCDGMTRRDFLRLGSLAAGPVGLSLADLQAADTSSRDVSCILLFLVGGPSQLDTWDMKPDAPSNIRGPFRPIQTNVPGIQICEHFPRMARLAHRYAIVRSVYHQAAPVHETGHQLMQTGYLSRDGLEYPHYGAVLSHLRGPRESNVPPFVVVPGPIGNTGVSVGHGQGAGYLGTRYEAVFPSSAQVTPRLHLTQVVGVDPARLRNRHELLDAIDKVQRDYDAEGPRTSGAVTAQAYSLLFSATSRRAFDIAAERDETRERYGPNTFGQSCLLARRLVEHGVRLVTVNMFDTVYNKTTWDCHADGGALGSTLQDYRDTLCPMFDRAYAALLEDLHQRGMLRSTLVVAMGEFGRTPQLNSRGGRDHWPGVWSMLFAGGGVRGGRVVGASDRIGAEPRARPVRPAEVAATIYRALGIDLSTRLPCPDGRHLPIVEAQPVDGLLRA
jgi:uncharacterized protein (DUF1501 family)